VELPASPADAGTTGDAAPVSAPDSAGDVGASAASQRTASLDRSFLRSVAWSGAGRWLPQLVSWPATIVIARMLSPADYGLVVLVRVYTDFIGMLTEAGLGSAVTIAPEMDDDRAGQLHTLSMIMGAIAVVVSCLIAYPLRNFYKHPGLEWVVLALSGIFIIEAAGVVPNGLLRREFRYKSLAIADWVRTAADLTIELTMAFLGFGYWTLIAGYLGGAIAWQAVVISSRRVAFRRVRLADVRSTLRTMGHMATQAISGFTVTNSDVMIAGRLFSTGIVGAYSFASQLAAVPNAKITSLVANVTPTLFREVRTDLPLLRRYVLLVMQALSVVVLPAFIGIALVAPDFALGVLGPKWGAMTVPLQFLALSAAVQSLFTVIPQVLWAIDRGRVVTRFWLVSLAVLPPLFFVLGRTYGVNGLAAAWLIGAPLHALPRARIALRAIELSPGAYLRNLWPALSSSAVMAVVVVGVQHLAGAAGWPPVARLVIAGVVGAVTYLGALMLFHGTRVRAVMASLRRMRR
jgi:PST family polysaccharide transporter